MKFYDAHNHLHDAGGEDVLPLLRQAGLAGAVVNGTRPGDWGAVEKITRGRDWLVPSYGLHPWFADETGDWESELVRVLAMDERAVVGEIGLDKARIVGVPMDVQERAFLRQLAIAARMARPATVHCVRCYGRLAALLEREERLPGRGVVLRNYAGSAEMVGRFAALAPVVFSFSGMVLHERNGRQRGALRAVPKGRLLLETDAPNMPLPEGLARYRLPDRLANHPANVVPLYEGVAKVLGTPVEELARALGESFHRTFARG